ncbi:AAA family ATPase [Nocardia amikacinitolerans]|uniref:AAA family ATPase n=1 Tax=Nocardia amikacinitolerans TaxID=756689 RepID=UPI0020A4EF02|nr:AAA family ATPase [Nocardia amikacinitolerans]MCP2290914.1 AAA domain-containing protein [Nocardia amikacinitolerans]
MKDAPALRLAVTGAPRTGKTTVCTALALATGLDYAAISTHPVTPGADRRLAPTVDAAVRGFEQRVDSEARLTSGFVSDGSVLQEWVAAEALRRTRRLRHWMWNPRDLPYRIFEKRYLLAHGGIVTRRANVTYDGFVHLRMDRESATEGDDRYRTTIDRLLLDTLHEGTVPYLVIGGSIEEIVTRVAGMYQLPQLMPVPDAVSAALHAA